MQLSKSRPACCSKLEHVNVLIQMRGCSNGSPLTAEALRNCVLNMLYGTASWTCCHVGLADITIESSSLKSFSIVATGDKPSNLTISGGGLICPANRGTLLLQTLHIWNGLGTQSITSWGNYCIWKKARFVWLLITIALARCLRVFGVYAGKKL